MRKIIPSRRGNNSKEIPSYCKFLPTKKFSSYDLKVSPPNRDLAYSWPRSRSGGEIFRTWTRGNNIFFPGKWESNRKTIYIWTAPKDTFFTGYLRATASIHCFANMFIASKFVVIFPCFFKHGTRLHQISLFLFEFRTTQRDWRFVFIRMFNKRTYIVDAIKIYSIMNFSFKYFSFVGVLSFAYFCVLMLN